MNLNEHTNDSNWNITPMKKENETPMKKENEASMKKECEIDIKRLIVKPKENRHFSEKWLSLFSPWLARCDDDYNRPFCRACQRPLDNNRFRLQRHERTAKHARNQEVLLNEGEEAVRRLHLTKTKRRFIKKERPLKSFTLDIGRANFETETTFENFKTLRAPVDKGEGDSNFVHGKREYVDMSDYYYNPHYHSRQPPLPPQPKKDSFDLFFEAISASVKSLPPKLAAEVKSRVSQVISEYELRAICEKEAQEKAQQQSVVTMPTQVTKIVSIDPVVTNTESNGVNISTINPQTVQCAPTVTQYVYSYQQKKEIN